MRRDRDGFLDELASFRQANRRRLRARAWRVVLFVVLGLLGLFGLIALFYPAVFVR